MRTWRPWKTAWLICNDKYTGEPPRTCHICVTSKWPASTTMNYKCFCRALWWMLEQSAADLLMSSLTLGPCIIGGDLNAHFGSLGDPHSIASPDIKGILWNDLLDTTSMYVPSLCETAMGPTHTYSSDGHHMTIGFLPQITVRLSFPNVKR